MAAGLSEGLVRVDVAGGEEILFSERYACTECGISFSEPAPRKFSFNSPYGACPECGDWVPGCSSIPISSFRTGRSRCVRGLSYPGRAAVRCIIIRCSMP